MGEIQLHQNELLGSFGPECLLVENLILQPRTPGAPVGAREIQEQELVLRLGLGFGRFKIGLPKIALGSENGSEQAEESRHGNRRSRDETVNSRHRKLR